MTTRRWRMERIKELRREVLSLTRTLYKTLGELTTELETPAPAPEPADRNEKLAKMLGEPLSNGCFMIPHANEMLYLYGPSEREGYTLESPVFINWLLDRLAATGHGYRENYQPDNQQHYFEVWAPAWEYSGEALNPDRFEAVLEAAYAAAAAAGEREYLINLRDRQKKVGK